MFMIVWRDNTVPYLFSGCPEDPRDIPAIYETEEEANKYFSLADSNFKVLPYKGEKPLVFARVGKEGIEKTNREYDALTDEQKIKLSSLCWK